MVDRHYLKRFPGVCVLILGLRRASVLVGTIIFALPPRETQKRMGGGITWELARLFIEDSVPQNAETFLIARGLRWIRRHHPAVQWVVSYSDPSAGHDGTIYRAANFKFDGMTDAGRKTPRFDYGDARTGKRYSRRGHVPEDAIIERIPRVSKARFVYRLYE